MKAEHRPREALRTSYFILHTSFLVLLPGLDGTDVFFRPFQALLPRSIRSQVVSFPPSDAGGYEDLLQLVRRAVSGLPEYYVLASSFSGPLAVLLAAAEPEKVRGIILCASFVRSPRENLRRFRFAAVQPAIWMLRAVRRLPIWTLRRRDDPLRRAKAETWARVSARSLAQRTRAILSVDVRDALRACRQPVLCIAFDDDTVVPHRNTEDIQRCCPGARLVTIPGGHLTIFTNPVQVIGNVTRFIEETAALVSQPH